MKVFSAFLAFFLFLGGNAFAAILTWNRNTEIDMKDYQVFACFTANCVVSKTAPMLQGTVVQTTTGNPVFVMDIAQKEGNVAVTARDTSLNESGLSVQVPFDAKAPSAPGGPHFQ